MNMLGFIQQANETVGCLCYTNVTGNFYKCMFIYISSFKCKLPITLFTKICKFFTYNYHTIIPKSFSQRLWYDKFYSYDKEFFLSKALISLHMHKQGISIAFNIIIWIMISQKTIMKDESLLSIPDSLREYTHSKKSFKLD